MRAMLALALVLSTAVVPMAAWGQDGGGSSTGAERPAAQYVREMPQTTLTYRQYDQLVMPVALYPDPLLAVVLPASTTPVEVAVAARWLAEHPAATAEDLQRQEWPAAVKALAHYPTVLAMMNDRLQWTQTLGRAYISNGDALMMAIQRKRATAKKDGTLETTEQVRVAADKEVVKIMPADGQMVYVPKYATEDPAGQGQGQVVYQIMPVKAGGTAAQKAYRTPGVYASFPYYDDGEYADMSLVGVPLVATEWRCDWENFGIVDRSGRDLRTGLVIGDEVVMGGGGGFVAAPNGVLGVPAAAFVGGPGYFAPQAGFGNAVFVTGAGPYIGSQGFFGNPVIPGYGYSFAPQPFLIIETGRFGGLGTRFGRGVGTGFGREIGAARFAGRR